MVSLSNSKFQSLSIRPPTPPKDLEDSDKDADEVLDFLSDPFGAEPPVAKVAVTKPLLNTPEQSPSSDGGVLSGSASRKKRVNFHPQPCTIRADGLAPQSFTPLHSSPLRPLPQTRVSKPLKSILKPSDAASTPPPADQGAPAHKYKSFAEMLESIMKQLASGRRPSSIDAYHSLHRTMQAYEKIPDMQALLDKMGLLTQFIRRDVQAVSINGNGLDSQLISQALKLLMTLVRLPELRTAMDDDFCNFIIDRIIHVASDETMPKIIINTHLAMLMQQTFRPKTMTPARAEKILDVLDTIHDRVPGSSVQAYRIRIYRKLIQQRPEVMTKHAERWFRYTLRALLNTQKDIHQSALDTVVLAAKAIGTERHVNKAVLAILNRPKADGDTCGKVVAKTLEKMLELDNSDNATMVPQIWASITALLLGSLNKTEFPAMADWLMVFQNCCNSANDSVKIHANVAFGFLIYAVNYKGREDALKTWSKMLISVPQYQLQRRGQLKKSERDAITSGYLTLLYYSFGPPQVSHQQLDRCWTEYVANFWTPLVHNSSPMHALVACRIVSALFNGTRRPFDPQRALELRPQAMIQREELPVLDAKWVRKSLPTILRFVETLLDVAPWTMEDCKDEPAKNMWLSLLHSLKAAGSQEVMASTESKDAMAYIVNLLRRVWDRHTAQLALSQEKEDSWADKFCFLLETIVEKLGPLQFSDKCLTRNGQDEFEVASTPSHRSRQQGPRTSPLLYFIDLLVNQSEGRLSDHVRLRALKLLIEPCYESQNTRLSRLEFLRDCAAVVDSSSHAIVPSTFWAQTAALVKACIEERSSDSSGGSRPLGKEYEVVVDILRLSSTHLLEQTLGREVLASFVDTVRKEAGEGGLVLAVIERVSENVFKRIPAEEYIACLPWLSVLLQNLPSMIVRRTVEQGRQKLWPSSATSGRNPDFDPYNYFYDAVTSIGSVAYHEQDSKGVDIVREFLAALTNSIKRCPIALLAVYVRKVQAAIRFWVEDPERKLQKKDHQSKELHAQVILLWKEVCAAIERLPNKDSQILLRLEPLLTAGFVSRRRGLVNMSIATWNATFGKEETLRYPSQLEQALWRLRNRVELSLPSLQIQDENVVDEPSFYESDDSVEEPKQQMKSPRVKESPFKVVKASRQSRSPAMGNASNRRTPTRRTPRVRLRHDNSQIQFEPISSSPSNPFVQDFQILTERQIEMVERQMDTTNLFANISSASSPRRNDTETSVHSPMELHSDARGADELPTEPSRTPLRTLPSLGPMDVFVGSSPTPQARSRTQEVVSDRTSVATPTAVRIARLDDDAEPGSSPPRYEKDAKPEAQPIPSNDGSDDVVGDSFDYRQPEQYFSVSLEEGTTVDDTVVLEAAASGEEVDEDMFGTEIEASDMLGSAIDLQLTAQIDADMQAYMQAASKKSEEVPQKAAAAPNVASLPGANDQAAENDMVVQDTQNEMPTRVGDSAQDAETSSTSRIGDSFSSHAAEMESPQVRKLRSSSRLSASPSASRPNSATKRSSAGRGPGRPKKNKSRGPETETGNSPAPSEKGPDEDGIYPMIVVASPRERLVTNKKRKSSLAHPESEVVVPETSRRRGVRRSVSLLSQVETHSEDVVVEDTPAPKRARQSLGQDVSSVKSTPKGSQVKRLSHIQVTPKRSSDIGSSVRGSSVAADETAPQAAGELVQGEPTVGEQNAEVAQQPPTDHGAAGEPQQSQASVSTPSRSFAERVILTPRSIINQLRSLKDALFRSSQLVLGRQEEREIDDALFEIRREVHQAGRRGEGNQ
ncbi:hypothetical protein K458DRAFT_327750 [Lentithecium fluviatile CBS 122367]|uniref:Telomere-associated protein Rif1 N-terminal domain-containing protein n=1 Tax=Lentithecium fluviatile CBS 122367 TaxID=1168545 RepID=A0A6G1JI15_9PLEO|nr:hypothetical protein K458DRAFT_327750 [Lentithecium fluviatile CBS 122367]